MGRYITQDPIKLIGGLNLYQYCPNPVNWVDPLGFKGMPGSVIKPNNTANAIKHEDIPITQQKFDEIINKGRSNRPNDVLEYLPEEYVQAHEALFEQQGGSFAVIDMFLSSEYTNLPARKFVALPSDMEKVITEYNAAGKDWNIFNKRLALGDENLSKAQIYIIRIKPGDPRFTYKMPTGNEIGAYAGEWTPGGMTKGGIKEAALEGAEVIKTDGTVETILKQFDDWERLQ